MLYLRPDIAAIMIYLTMQTAAACVNPHLSERDYSAVGIVKNTDGDVIYEEHHNHKADETGGISEVKYKSTTGRIIARKILDYNCRASAPDYVLTMHHDQKWIEEVRWQSDKLVVTHPEGKEILDVVDNNSLIIDAGFDNFVYENWSELMLGVEKEFDFLHVKGNDLYRLVIKLHAGTPDIAVPTDVVLFKIMAKNRFFRLFSEPIYLGYNKQTRLLDFYFGPTNLRGDVAGLEKSKQITINYLYN